MDGQLILSYPWYFLVFCLFFGLAVAGWMYYRDRLLKEHPVFRIVLFSLRASLVAGLAFLLLAPLWKGIVTRTEKPIVLYLEDISQSVGEFTAEADMAAYVDGRERLYNALAENFEVERYRFGSGLMTWADSVPGAEKASDISGAINELLEIHSYQNVGAMIVASDGIYNRGFNPAYSNISASTSIYTIALGDSTPSRDLFIQALQYPRVVYLGDQFQLDLEWGAYNLSAGSVDIIFRDESGTELSSRRLNINSDEVFGKESIIVDASKPGIQRVNVSLSGSLPEDVNANNSLSAYIEVLDGRKNVLLVYDAPHPDVKAVKSVIENNRNYAVDAFSAERFYRTSDQIDEYDLVVLHGLPSQASGSGSDILLKCRQKGKSVVIIISSGSDITAFNAGQEILSIMPSGSQVNEVQGLLNNDFNDFRIPTGLNEALRNYPPLITPFAEYRAGPNSSTIVWQRLGDINTGYPMIITGLEETARLMIVTGEGIWRWRMMEYAASASTEVFDAFINQLIQYVSVKEDKRKFRLFVNKNLAWENEAVRFNAELYNANYELINESEVRLAVRSASGENYEFAMDKTLNAYTLDAGLLPVGNYTATASAAWAGENFVTEVKFAVREVQLETLNKQADHQMLYNLSAATGGAAFSPGDMEDIPASIRENVNLKPVRYTSEKTTSLMHFQWIFFILLGLMSLEWFVRKWLGGF
jgi:hypothetical protein